MSEARPPIVFREHGPHRAGLLLILLFAVPFALILRFDPPLEATSVQVLWGVVGICMFGALLCAHTKETVVHPGRRQFRYMVRVAGVPVWFRSARFDDIRSVELRIATTWGDEGGLDAPRLVLRIEHELAVWRGETRLRFRKGVAEADEPMDGVVLLAWLEDRKLLEFMWDGLAIAEMIDCRVRPEGQGWDHQDPTQFTREDLKRRASKGRPRRVRVHGAA
jgi:hypothetical protein